MMPYNPALLDAAVATIKRRCTDEAKTFAAMIQARMRSDAPWTDRNTTTPNARQSLEAEAGDDGGDVQIVARSTSVTKTGAPLGLFLEEGTVHMAARAVIKPTMDALAPTFIATLQRIIAQEL